MRVWRMNNGKQLLIVALLLAAAVYFFWQTPTAGIGAAGTGLLLLAGAAAIPFFLCWRLEAGEGGLTFHYLPPRAPRRIQWREIRGIKTLQSGSGEWYQLQLRDGMGPSIPPGPMQKEMVEYIAISAGLKKQHKS